MVNNNAHSNENEKPVAQTAPEATFPSKRVNRASNVLKYTIIGISLATLVVLAAFFVSFLYGWYGLYVMGLVSLVAIPFILIGGAIICGIKGKWITLGLGIIILPPAWVITLLGCMSEPPWDPSDISSHLIYATVLISGAFACWLFLTLTFWQGRPNPTAEQITETTENNKITGAKQNNNYGIVALVAGIGGLLFSYFFSLGIVPAIVALLCGIQARKRGQKYADAGVNLGRVGIVVNILILIMFFIFSSIYYN